MNKKNFFSIGEVSKLAHIPIRTLRYYDQIDLVKPAFVDHETNYRFYSYDQLFIISIIKELKLFEFSLADIKQFLQRESLDKVKELYKKKQIEIEKQMKHLQRIKARIENRFELFKDYFENQSFDNLIKNNFYIEIKKIPDRLIVYKRYHSAFNLDIFSVRCIELHNIIEDNNLYIKGPFMAIFHGDYYGFDENYADIETCGPIYEDNKTNYKLPFIRKLEGGSYASVVCKGSHDESKEAYLALKKWIIAHDFEMIGPAIKIYIINIKLIKQTQYFTIELQVKIRKK